MHYNKTIISLLLSLLLCSANVVAETSYSDIQLLIGQGQYKEALTLTESQLTANKSDIKLQFMRGLILTRLDRFSDAEQVFTQLTIDNPELPEPFNNLAVVYAAQGKYRQAEQALNSAINTHPSYATAHENLGDIYAKMASRAYNQALELDTGNKTARQKLSLVNELISAPVEADKTVVAKVEAKPIAKPVARPVQEPEVITIPVKEKSVVAKAEQQKVAKPAVKKDDVKERLILNRQAVEVAIRNWAKAWSAQDVNAYLASYGQEFIPPKRLSRSAWEKDRRKKLRRPSFIKVTLTDMKINLHGKDYAEVKFSQAYQSDTYSDKVKKEILMRKVADKWLITQERSE